MATVMISLILPWSMRNKHLLGQFVLISTNAGPNLWMGNNPTTTGFYQQLPQLPPHIGMDNEVTRDRELRNQALAYIWKEPSAFLIRSLVKAMRLYERETIGVHWNAKGLSQRYSQRMITGLKWFGQVHWILFLGLAITGVIRLVRAQGIPRTALSPPVLLWLYFTLVYAISVIQDRYHFPVIPMIAMLASVALFMPPCQVRMRETTASSLAPAKALSDA